MKRSRLGFTLVEMMIVVLIIGVLMSIAVPNYVQGRNMSRVNSCIENLREIEAAKEQWAMVNGKKQTDVPAMSPDLVPNYMKNVPSCPTGGVYSVNNVGTEPTCTIANHVLP